MNVKDSLRNYRKTSVQISMAIAIGKVNAEIEKMIEQKSMLDKAIEMLIPEQFMAIDGYFRKGLSYEKIARKGGYAKSTISYHTKIAINSMQKVFD